jgi:hypothetical protein
MENILIYSVVVNRQVECEAMCLVCSEVLLPCGIQN